MVEIKSLILQILNSSQPRPTDEERNLLLVAYKNVIACYTTPHHVVLSIRDRLETKNEFHNVKLTERFMKNLQEKCIEITVEIIEIIDKILQLEDQSVEDCVYYWKQKGDLYRNIARVDYQNSGLDWKGKSLECYEISNEFSTKLSILNPLILGMILSQAVFKYEVVGECEKAVEIAQTAFSKAMKELEILIESGEDISSEITLILQLFRDNLSDWTADVKGPDED